MALREIQLSKKFKGPSFIYRKDFYDRDIEDSITSFTPGEWAIAKTDGAERLLVMVNHLAQNGPKVRSLVPWQKDFVHLDEWQILQKLIERCLLKRSLFSNLNGGSRIIYGDSDNIPGLIVDQYKNAVFIQINSAGIDKFRHQLKSFFSEKFGVSAYLFDQQEYRSTEGLPQFAPESLPSTIAVEENDFKFQIPTGNVQKIGHYYDHRNNRSKLEMTLNNFKGNKERGLDLFCYSGAWGLGALRGGIEHMIFVDQAPFKEIVLEQLKVNGFEGRGDFVRDDVFEFLTKLMVENKKFNVIISDPPAFSKSLKNKSKALLGYEKLHTSCLKLLAQDSLFAVASCTHGITHDELDRTVLEATKKTGRRVQLLDMGCQGPDHPFSHLHDSSFYIKYLLYFVE